MIGAEQASTSIKFINKTRALFVVWIKDSLAYRANMIIWILTDTVPAMIMPLVLIAAIPEGGNIRGFEASQFVLYYLTMLICTNFIQSHVMWDMAYEIRDGRFSIYLLRPVSYFHTSYMMNLAWRMLRTFLFLPFLGVLILIYWKYLGSIQPYLGWETWVAIVLGHFVSFSFVFMMAMLALFFEEVTSVFGLYYIPMLFLSGQIFPVDLLPTWATNIAKIMPFYYTTALPTEIIIGRLSTDASHTFILGQCAWILANLIIGRYLWKWGLTKYSAVGM